MIISEQSKLEGREHIAQIEEYLAKGDNVILLSNHQTEADPQVISILLESIGKGHLAEKIIFVAGHKVTSDPVAIPFSMVSDQSDRFHSTIYMCEYIWNRGGI